MAEYILVRLALAALGALPFGASVRVARFYFRILDTLVPRLNRVARRNIEIAGLSGSDEITGEMWESLARSLAVFARFPKIDRANVRDWIRYEGLDHYTEAKRRGRGVLFATAHLGNWELSAFAHALLTEPMNVVVRPLDNPLLDSFVSRRRTLSGNRAIGKREAARSILRALKNNEAVGVLIDQNVLPAEGVFVDFFGVPACAGAVFAKLAAHSGAAVIPGFALWCSEEHRYVLRFYPPVEMTGDLRCDTQRIHSQLEQVIREHPGQWLWLHRRWKTRPPGDPSLY
jgi:Kdo2-lipid IVA lauroyltransferase/acyltransferase